MKKLYKNNLKKTQSMKDSDEQCLHLNLWDHDVKKLLLALETLCLVFSLPQSFNCLPLTMILTTGLKKPLKHWKKSKNKSLCFPYNNSIVDSFNNVKRFIWLDKQGFIPMFQVSQVLLYFSFQVGHKSIILCIYRIHYIYTRKNIHHKNIIYDDYMCLLIICDPTLNKIPCLMLLVKSSLCWLNNVVRKPIIKLS